MDFEFNTVPRLLETAALARANEDGEIFASCIVVSPDEGASEDIQHDLVEVSGPPQCFLDSQR